MQKVHDNPHSYERAIRSLHDHLYANSNLREPEAIHAEMAKVIRVLLAATRHADPHLDASTLRAMYPEVHGGQSAIALDNQSISSIVESIQRFDLSSAERDFVGDALEVMRSTAAKRLGGQFFTDQRVTRLAVELLDYSAAEHDFVDICAGTGGFLIAAAAAARAQGSQHAPILGTEIDPKIAGLAQSALGELNSGAVQVFREDALRPTDAWTSAKSLIREGTHMRLASNPPFGIKILVRDQAILRNYELARFWRKVEGRWQPGSRIVPRPPDILFIERNLQLARPGVGRVAIVTPYQALSGPRLGFVREWLLRNARILAVVDLPAHTFQPWTGTKTSLLVFERRESPLSHWDVEGSDDPRVFMAQTQHIGHDRRGNPVLDADGAIVTDLPAVGRAWKRFRGGQPPDVGNAESYSVDSASISSANDLRLNAAFHHPRATGMKERLLGRLPDGYQVVTLGGLVDRVWCPGRFKRRYTQDPDRGVLFLGGSNICQFDIPNRKYIEQSDPRLEELRVEEGWILITRSGSTGIVSRVTRSWSGLAVSDHVIRIAPNPELLDPDYLETFLRSRWGQQLVAAGVFGSVIDEITPEAIAALPVPIPTDPTTVARIAAPQATANAARDEVASGLGFALDALDDALGRHFG